jgi:hypothetical protein
VTPQVAANAIDYFWALKRAADNASSASIPILTRLQVLLEDAKARGCNTDPVLRDIPRLLDHAKNHAWGSLAPVVGQNQFRVRVFQSLGLEAAPAEAVWMNQ